MSLATPPKVEKLRTALHAKAKASPAFRFYALYDKVYRADILAHAYDRCRANQGAAGVDDQTFADIEAYGIERWLAELAKELQSKTYQASPVRRVWIPKPNGRQRPLGIPTIRDRVVQMATVLVLEPIFEADLPPEQYAYRPGKSALDAVQSVQALLGTGYTDVVDADLSEYFESIPHHEFFKSVARRVSDRHLLHLLKMWLTAPVEETDEKGRTVRTTRNKDAGKGAPQGGVVSPLLANLYMRRFILGWRVLGHEERLQAVIVNYADDQSRWPPGRIARHGWVVWVADNISNFVLRNAMFHDDMDVIAVKIIFQIPDQQRLEWVGHASTSFDKADHGPFDIYYNFLPQLQEDQLHAGFRRHAQDEAAMCR